jgi:hypothetical protein
VIPLGMLGAATPRAGAGSFPFSSLLHFDGADGSTAFSDVTGKSWTRYGSILISTTESKFGGASGRFNGTSQYIDTGASSDFVLGTDDFTLELQYRPDDISAGYRCLLADLLYNSTGGWALYQNGANLEFWRGGAKIAERTGSLAATTWQHIAVSRVSGQTRVFREGVSGSAGTDTTNYTNNRFQIGHVLSSGIHYYAKGYIDEVRFTKGTGLYSSTFTPPSSAFPDS